MARRTQTYAIRLAVEGGGQVKAELVSVGQSGEQSLKRIESAGERASGGLKGARPPGGAAAHRHPHARRRARRASPRSAGSPRWSIARSRRPMPSARPPTRSGSASRRCRSCASPPRRPASSSRRSTWRCSASPAVRPRRRRARARRRTRWRRWASRCATRAATCAAARTCWLTSPTPSPASRIRPSGVRLAFKLFDSEGVALVNLLSDGSGALEEMRERARDLGIVLDEHLVRDAERARTELDTLSQVISANLTRAALEAAPVIADLSSWLADVAGKAGIAWERLFDAPEEKSLRTLRYELDLGQLDDREAGGADSGAAGVADARLHDLHRHGADQRAGAQARRAAARPRSDPGPDRVPRRAAGHRGAGSGLSARSRRHRGRAGPGQEPGADRARARGHAVQHHARGQRSGSSPSTSAGSPRSRRCGPRTAATPSRSTS